MAKSLDLYGDAVRSVEVSLGGAWILHVLVASGLGFIAAWSTPKLYYQCGRFVLSPWVFLLLAMVAVDELLQMFNPLRHFSVIDLSINLTCVTFGALAYVTYLKSPLGDSAV